MADIVKFRCIDGGAPDTSYLNSDEPALFFKTTPEGQLDLEMGRLSTRPRTVSDAASHTAIRDWGNQEKANLFRVKRLLDAAGVACEVDRGITDEGDPWFVFCRADGDVFAHFCRVDGLYILDSPTIDRPLRGRDFNSLINDFTGLSKTASGSSLETEDTTEHRVVRLSRNSTLRLHPTAILAALIWTFLISSEELVLVQPDVEEDGAADGLEAFFAEDRDAAARREDEDGADVQPGDRPQNTISVKDIEKYGPLQTGDKTGQFAQTASAAPNNAALALNTLAINLGFLSEVMLTEKYSAILAELEAASGHASFFHAETAHTGERQTTVIPGSETHDTAEASVAAARIDAASLLEDVRDDKASQNHAEPAVQDSFELSFATPDAVLFSAETVTPSSAGRTLKSRADIPLEVSKPADQLQPEITLDLSSLLDSSDSMSFKDVLDAVQQAWQPVLREYRLDAIKIQSSFDVTAATDVVDRVLDLVQPDATEPSSGVIDAGSTITFDDISSTDGGVSGTIEDIRYDDNARQYIDHVISTSDVDVLFLEGHLIVIDTDVLANPMEQRFIQTWEFDDGGSVSLIGLQSDFDSYLIA
jgi:hypothetical protein